MKTTELQKRFLKDATEVSNLMKVAHAGWFGDLRHASLDELKDMMIQVTNESHQAFDERYKDYETVPDNVLLNFMISVAGAALAFADGAGVLAYYARQSGQDN